MHPTHTKSPCPRDVARANCRRYQAKLPGRILSRRAGSGHVLSTPAPPPYVFLSSLSFAVVRPPRAAGKWTRLRLELFSRRFGLGDHRLHCTDMTGGTKEAAHPGHTEPNTPTQRQMRKNKRNPRSSHSLDPPPPSSSTRPRRRPRPRPRPSLARTPPTPCPTRRCRLCSRVREALRPLLLPETRRRRRPSG
jgi:hypothetical protein